MDFVANDTILYVNDLEVGYGAGSDYTPILKGINMLENDVIIEGQTTGQTIAVIGRSGRGKSTLFKALTGLLTPMKGQALIRDVDEIDKVVAKLIKEGDVGLVDQNSTLFRHKTVNQIMKYGLRNGRLEESSGKDEETIIKEYLQMWGLQDHSNKYASELSGGQRKRVAIIEQLLSKKHFMILDEPFAGLDVGNIRDVKGSFSNILENHELNTILFSTHRLELAVELAESIYVIGFPTPKSECATIVKHYDLKEMGLAWQEFDSRHLALVKEIDEVMMNS
jgi:ABC-type nitrate/sulfonate/bicarbonate transport system ATPase subunit